MPKTSSSSNSATLQEAMSKVASARLAKQSEEVAAAQAIADAKDAFIASWLGAIASKLGVPTAATKTANDLTFVDSFGVKEIGHKLGALVTSTKIDAGMYRETCQIYSISELQHDGTICSLKAEEVGRYMIDGVEVELDGLNDAIAESLKPV